MKGWQPTPEQLERAAERRRQGATIREVARELGVSADALGDRLRKAGIFNRVHRGGGKPTLTREQVAEAVRRRREGVMVEALAHDFGLATTTMSAVLRKAGVTGLYVTRRSPSRQQIQQMQDLYAQGMSIQDIAKTVGTSWATVSRKLSLPARVLVTQQQREKDHKRQEAQEFVGDVNALRGFLVTCQHMNNVYLTRMEKRAGYRLQVLDEAMSGQPWDMSHLEEALRRVRKLVERAIVRLDERGEPHELGPLRLVDEE